MRTIRYPFLLLLATAGNVVLAGEWKVARSQVPSSQQAALPPLPPTVPKAEPGPPPAPPVKEEPPPAPVMRKVTETVRVYEEPLPTQKLTTITTVREVPVAAPLVAPAVVPPVVPVKQFSWPYLGFRRYAVVAMPDPQPLVSVSYVQPSAPRAVVAAPFLTPVVEPSPQAVVVPTHQCRGPIQRSMAAIGAWWR